MRSAFLEDAEPSAVSHAVRKVLETRGVLVREHVSTRVRFQSQPDRWSWTRAGYVGFYQPHGEKDVELRLILRARWPHRLFWGTSVGVLVVGLLTMLVNPPGTTWFLVAFMGGAALLVSTLLYVNTWRSTAEEERVLMEAIEAELREEGVATTLAREEEREIAVLEADLAGEIERRRLTREAKAEKAAERAEKAAQPKTPRKLPSFRLRKP